jgi:hypothetical protein
MAVVLTFAASLQAIETVSHSQPSKGYVLGHYFYFYDAILYAQVETACEEKKGRTGTEIQKNVLANGSLFGPICI